MKTIEEIKKVLEKKKLQNYIDKLAKKYEGKKILAYGTGLMAEHILDSYDISKLNLVGFADSKYLYQKEDFRGLKTFSPDDIQELAPDVIIAFVYYEYLIKEFFEVYYPEIKQIPLVPLVERNFIEKLFDKM
jgi:ABC-type Fe3+-hydroxamate transport system substrate-binding protein